jgi:hypothetical protein
MSLSERDLLRQYGEAATAGNAALFIGAGLSASAGYPGWTKLLKEPRKQARIPDSLQDLPLVAEYIVQSLPGGRETLEHHILSALGAVPTSPSAGHQYIAELPISDIWTTNYDPLVEEAIPEATPVYRDEDLLERRRLGPRRVVKMHGSIRRGSPPRWEERPVITRRDYESYEVDHPRLWAALKATYLTKSMLFLGFSFTDPNIEILLRLSRSLLDVGAPEHFTVLRRPTAPGDVRLHELRVEDLQKSGVAVTEIEEYDELIPLLRSLVRRTRPRLLFVSGSKSAGSDISEHSRLLGDRLAEWRISLVSLAGQSAMRVSYSLGRMLLAENRYEPDRIRFYFRGHTNPPPQLEQRIGTAVYTAFSTEDLRSDIVSQCRAAVIIGGGDHTVAEVEVARTYGVPVIPIARTGGAARSTWDATDLSDPRNGLRDIRDVGDDWSLLNHEEVSIAVAAATRLIVKAMYLDSSVDRLSVATDTLGS